MINFPILDALQKSGSAMTSKTGAVTTTTATGTAVAAGKDSPKTKTEVDGSWGGNFLAVPCNNNSFLLMDSTFGVSSLRGSLRLFFCLCLFFTLQNMSTHLCVRCLCGSRTDAKELMKSCAECY